MCLSRFSVLFKCRSSYFVLIIISWFRILIVNCRVTPSNRSTSTSFRVSVVELITPFFGDRRGGNERGGERCDPSVQLCRAAERSSEGSLFAGRPLHWPVRRCCSCQAAVRPQPVSGQAGGLLRAAPLDFPGEQPGNQ